MKSIKIVINDVEYSSIAQLATAYNVSRQKLQYRYNKGLRGNELVESKNIGSLEIEPIEVNGVMHNKIKPLSKACKVSLKTLNKRYKEGARGSMLIHNGFLFNEYMEIKKIK